MITLYFLRRAAKSNGRVMDRSNTLDSTVTSPGVLIDEQPTSALGRVWKYVKHEIRRPSVLSSTSESDTTGLDILDSATPATRDALRLLTNNGKGRRKSTLRSGTRRGESSIGGPLTPGDDLDEKDDGDPVEIVVIENDMPEEEDLARHASAGGGTDTWTPSDAGGKAKSPRSKTSGGEAMTGKVMSKLKAFWILVYYFFNSKFAERTKERSFLKEVGARHRLDEVKVLQLTPEPAVLWPTTTVIRCSVVLHRHVGLVPVLDTKTMGHVHEIRLYRHLRSERPIQRV